MSEEDPNKAWLYKALEHDEGLARKEALRTNLIVVAIVVCETALLTIAILLTAGWLS